MKTVLITGCSSGFGLDAARRVLEREWNVVATMRTPREDVLPKHANMRILPLDVTSADSIRHAVDAAGPIDALVNNAGYGLLNALEGTSIDAVRALFETNTFGTFALTQAVVPQMRARKSGVIINVTSSVTLKPLRLLSVYTASKAAVNAFTECLALELEPFSVRAHLVLPGRAPSTKFGENARAVGAAIPEPYMPILQSVMASFQNDPLVTESRDVTAAIWRAATDACAPQRIPAGADAVALSA
jgi:NAD(P)-dependent dehydrogenase (short-subunit alcohol dehydrogenase family)